MAVTFVKRSALPQAIRGKEGSLSVVVTGNGQVQLSKKSTDALGNPDKIVMGFDGAKVYLFRADSKTVAKVDPKDMIQTNKPKKGGTIGFAASAILRSAKDYGASHIYDFKKSGNQSFNVTADEKNGYITFELPTALAPKPVVHRRKKVKAAVATMATPQSTEGTPVQEEELILESA